jgi:hypothetical protein
MQFRVVIPEHVRSGQYIRVHAPTGAEVEMRVPKGLKPGDSFVFDISDSDSKITIANDIHMLNQQVAGSSNTTSTTGTSNKVTGTSAGSDQNTSSNFLDREVLHFKDFLVALGIGLVIGISIVVGFVLGILSATSGIQERPFHGAVSDTTPGGIGVYQLQSLQHGKLLQQQQSLQEEQQQGHSHHEL